MEEKNQIIEEALNAFESALDDLTSEYYDAWYNANTMRPFNEYRKSELKRLSEYRLHIEKAREVLKG
jgi:hypothetical protein